MTATDLIAAVDAEIAALEQRHEAAMDVVNVTTEKLAELRSFRESYGSKTMPPPVEASKPAPTPAATQPTKPPRRTRGAVATPRPTARKRQQRKTPAVNVADQVLDLLRHGPRRAAELTSMIGCSQPTMTSALEKLHTAGKIAPTGEIINRSKVWTLVTRQVAGATAAKPASAGTTNDKDGTLEGRVMACLIHQRPTVTQLVNELDESREDIEAVLEKLKQEGEARGTATGQWEAMP